MNLVDILARELKKWPEGLHGCDSITQDDDGLLNSTGTGCVPNRVGGAWRSGASSYIENGQNGELRAELSCDWDTAIVTRAQWQAAVDALKAGEQVWDGEGLPPVGTVCEFQHRNAPNGVWHPTSIRYSSHAHIIYVDTIDNSEACFTVGEPCKIDFRRARTAEQIAAEERQDILDWLVSSYRSHGLNGIAGALHSEGYRKQVQP